MNVRLAPSPIHGAGVFANELIEEGHWQYVYGDLRKILPGAPDELYCFEWLDDVCFTPYAPWCCLNHSTEPNAEIDYVVEYKHLTISALRDIQPNEEITIDYGYDPSDD